MDLLGLIKLVMQHWRVTIPVLLLTVVVAVIAQTGAPEVYEASGSILVAEPPSDPTTDPVILTEPARIARELRLSDDTAEVDAAANVSDVNIEAIDDQALRISVTGAAANAAEGAATTLADVAVGLIEQAQAEAEIAEDERIRALFQQVDVVPANEGAEAVVATADVVLQDPMGDVDNPFNPDPATARLLQVSVQSDAQRQVVAAETNDEIEFELNQDPLDSAPILEVYVTAPSQDAALNGFSVLVDVLASDLEDRQIRAGVRSSDRLVVEVLAAPQEVRDVSPPISRAVAVILALGILLSLTAAMFADSIVRRRAQANRPGSSADSEWFWGAPGVGITDADDSSGRADGAERRSGVSPTND